VIKTLAVGDLQTNCHLLIDEEARECVVIDPGAEPLRIIEAIGSNKVTCIVNTHGHDDHIGANAKLKAKYSCPICVHRLDAPMLTDPNQNLSSSFFLAGLKSPAAGRLLEEGDEITCGKFKLKVLHTPGHTPGSICLISGGFIFTGDTLFCGSVGRWDLPGGNATELKKSIGKLALLPDSLKIYSGHGDSSVLKEELAHNPFFTDSTLYE